ncbi:protein phosphatase CheZ [Stappia sp. WLB 29]|uniref:protein phosphatase CheZ n=1 Tax=Stappia sp. WLB 29 TaxID=2925220 RepID=UPI0020C038FC|nr:protein phosphatase CheZ [Stappia sp. WLB 29]
MADMGTPSAIRESDYEALLAALTDTDRGRWFLDEYMRRNQKPETQMVLDAIARLEKVMVRERTVPSIDRIRLDIADMQEAIERTKREIANIKHEQEEGNRFIEASNELDAIVTKTESATQEILAAAEAIQETAWTLRENGADQESCDDIDARATEIFMACSFQDLTGQRTQKIVQVLQYLESRINLMISIWGLEGSRAQDTTFVEDSRPDAHLLNGPQLDGKGVSQDAVDEMFDIEAVDFDALDVAGDGAAEAAEAAGGFSGETASADEIDAIFASAGAGADAETDADIFDAGELSDKQEESARRMAGLEFDEIDFADADIFEKPGEHKADRPVGDDFDDVVMVDDEDTAAWDAEFEVVPNAEATPAPKQRAEPADEGEDPLDRLSPGEKQSLFS